MASTLTHTFSTPTGNKKFTLSMWVKRADIDSDGSIFSTYTDSNNRADIRFNSANRFSFFEKVSSQQYYVTTKRLFRDPSAFYHIVVQFDTTQSTAADRIKLWVNGAQETSFNDTSYPSQDYVLRLGSALAHTIGDNSNNADQFEGYISHMAYVDGSVVAPTSFGLTDSTSGIWKIKTGSAANYGTNGFFLKFENSGAMGTDSSGNSNTFTVNGNLKQALDTPSNVHATWNPMWSQSNGNIGDVVFSNGNLTTITSASYRTTPTTLGMKSAKYYWEIKRDEAQTDTHFGVMSENATPANTATWIGNAANGWILAGDNGQLYTGGSTVGSPLANGSVASGAIFMGAYDGSTGKLYFGVNGTWAGTANPSTGANPHFTLDNSLTYFPVVSTGADVSANFGNGFFGTTAVSSAGSNGNGSIFEYDVPSGYYALNTKNINTYE